jgi:hypothetical protein
MAETNVGDAVQLTFEAIAGLAVAATVIPPGAGTPFTDPVPADTTAPAHYPYTVIPDRRGVWRVHFAASGQGVASETYTVSVTDESAGPAPYATSATVAGMWRDLSPAEATQVDVLCRYASAIIRAKVPTVDARVTSGVLNADIPALVCAQMVLRVLRNPSGIAAETVGPYSVTYGSTGTEASGRLTLTDEDVALLTGTPAGGRRGTSRRICCPSRFAPAGPPLIRAFGAEEPWDRW